MVLSPAQSLLLEHIPPTLDARVLLLEGGYGTLAVEVARLVPDGIVLNLNRDVRAFWTSQTLLDSIPNAAAEAKAFPTTTGWDLVLLTIPKERRFSRTLLLAAWQALRPGGTLLLSGPTRRGAKAVITDAGRLFVGARVVGYRHHQRVASCTRGEAGHHLLPETFQQAGIALGTSHTFEVQQPLGTLTLETHPGIFSWEALDEGTSLLLEHMEITPGMRIWDVGCGYGVIGLSAAQAGASQIWMSDINLLAIDYAQRNAVRNHLDHHVRVFPADGVDPPQLVSPEPVSFDLVISNPAFHQGQNVDRTMANQLITQASTVLAPNGKLVIVANRFLNYNQIMQSNFQHVTRLVENPRFHLLQGGK